MNRKAIEEMPRDLFEQVTRTGQALVDARIRETLHAAGVSREDIAARRIRCHVSTHVHPECCGTGLVIDGNMPDQHEPTENARVTVRLCSCLKVEITKALPI